MKIISDLRKAVLSDPRPQSAIAKMAKIHPKTFSAFMNKRRGLSADTLQNLAHALGLELRLEVRVVKPKR